MFRFVSTNFHRNDQASSEIRLIIRMHPRPLRRRKGLPATLKLNHLIEAMQELTLLFHFRKMSSCWLDVTLSKKMALWVDPICSLHGRCDCSLSI